jgi:hypothetical protein
MSFNAKRIAQHRMRKRLEIVALGFSDLCGQCEELHDPDPQTVPLCGRSHRAAPDPAAADYSRRRSRCRQTFTPVMIELAELQHRHGKAFENGERVPLGAATQRYGREAYRVMHVLLYDAADFMMIRTPRRRIEKARDFQAGWAGSLASRSASGSMIPVDPLRIKSP